MEQAMASYHFARFMTALYLQQIKDLSEEELHLLTSTLIMMTSSIGSKYENLKVTSTDNLLTFISASSLVINSCESWKRVMLKREENGLSCFKSVKQLESHIFYLKETQTKLTQQLTRITV